MGNGLFELDGIIGFEIEMKLSVIISFNMFVIKQRTYVYILQINL